MMQYRCIIPVTAIFTATLLIANTLDTKIFVLFGMSLPAGIIVFPLAYLAGDVLTEVYGYAAARRIIWSGFAALLLMVGSYLVAEILPPAGFWENQDAFSKTFTQVPRIVCASMLAYLCGEFVNSFVVAKMKVATKGRWISARFVASTIAGQFVDTTVFVAVAFFGLMPPQALLEITLSGWGVKVAWEVIAIPLTVVVVRWIKRVENVDYYDVGTNFNPFHL